jgi:hypothetical protein
VRQLEPGAREGIGKACGSSGNLREIFEFRIEAQRRSVVSMVGLCFFDGRARQE